MLVHSALLMLINDTLLWSVTQIMFKLHEKLKMLPLSTDWKEDYGEVLKLK